MSKRKNLRQGNKIRRNEAKPSKAKQNQKQNGLVNHEAEYYKRKFGLAVVGEGVRSFAYVVLRFIIG